MHFLYKCKIDWIFLPLDVKWKNLSRTTKDWGDQKGWLYCIRQTPVTVCSSFLIGAINVDKITTFTSASWGPTKNRHTLKIWDVPRRELCCCREAKGRSICRNGRPPSPGLTPPTTPATHEESSALWASLNHHCTLKIWRHYKCKSNLLCWLNQCVNDKC